MKLTPLEIESHQFATSWRGYDQDEVRAYLAQISLELTQLLSEHSALQESHRLLKERLQHTEGYEERLRDAMLTATQLREQLRDEAEREAQVVIREAELRAEELMAQGRASVRELHQDVLSMKEQGRRAASELRAILESHLKLLAYHEEELDGQVELSKQLSVGAQQRDPFDDEALQQAQELTLMLGDELEPPPSSAPVERWPYEAERAQEPVRARVKPSGLSGGERKRAPRPEPSAVEPRAESKPSSVGLSSHGSEMLQQVLSQIPQRVDPRELSLPPQAIKAEED